jgi:hypothetical protein
MMARITAGDDSSMRKKVQFLICDSCFWCASVLDDSMAAGACPLCKSSMLESIPLAEGESCRFDHNPTRGVVLEFIAG